MYLHTITCSHAGTHPHHQVRPLMQTNNMSEPFCSVRVCVCVCLYKDPTLTLLLNANTCDTSANSLCLQCSLFKDVGLCQSLSKLTCLRNLFISQSSLEPVSSTRSEARTRTCKAEPVIWCPDEPSKGSFMQGEQQPLQTAHTHAHTHTLTNVSTPLA